MNADFLKSEQRWANFILQEILSYHPSGAEGRIMWRNRFWDVWERYSGYVIGPILILSAWLLSHFV